MIIQINSQHKISRSQLKEDVEVSKNRTKFKMLPDTIIIHYTAGRDASSSVSWLANPNVKASAHVVIDQAGAIYQLVPFDTIAWHSGKSSYRGRSAFNQFSIGIELDNPGFLTPLNGEYASSFGVGYPAAKVINAVHRNEIKSRYWHTYTADQIESCRRLCEALMAKYPIKQILGHEEICPGEKTDPGPAFPLDDFRDRLLSNLHPWDTEHFRSPFADGVVKTDRLTMREGPGQEFEMIDHTLAVNKRVTVTGVLDGWYCIKTDIEGWVNSGSIGKQPKVI